MDSQTKKFAAFIALIFGSAGVCGMLIGAKQMRGYELHIGIGWIAIVLLGTGFIIDGYKGAVDLLGYTVLSWVIAAIGAIAIAWMVISSFGRSL
ncbi:hypothetical protein GOZ96_04695 [Agrobacterium vitis]|uniref:hypothetical protein n=1 Tax=Agrobacterium vitis TaxID=373 RepID=UPI0012301781|nr:hypothetical protein [Agrobacterium vitis]MUZ95887.1 hypothetical protein [Agrobacterium vitis]